jgi:hypothetical protein
LAEAADAFADAFLAGLEAVFLALGAVFEVFRAAFRARWRAVFPEDFLAPLPAARPVFPADLAD